MRRGLIVVETVLLVGFLAGLAQFMRWVHATYGDTALYVLSGGLILVSLAIARWLDIRHPRRPRQ